MKKLKTLIYTASVMLLGACSNHDAFEKPVDNNVLNFESNIVQQALTRVIDNNWELGDAIGVYALNSADQTLFGGFSNVKYNSSNAGAKGQFTPDASNPGISLDGATAVDIKAYYPFKEGVVDFVYPIDVTTTTPLVDLLYANNIKSIKDNGNPDLTFTHQLSKFELVLSIDATQGNLVTSLAGLTAKTVDGTIAKGEFNLSTGALAFAETAQAESITPIFNVGSEGKSALVTAYLVPGQSTNTIEVPMVLDGKTFVWKATTALDLQSGKQYTFKAALREIEEGKVILVNPDASIQDWEVGHEDTDPGQVDPSEDDKSLTVTEREFAVNADGGSKTFDVSASEGLDWIVALSEGADWITAVKEDSKVKVTVEPNETPDARTMNVVLSADGVADVVITVTQEGKKDTPTEASVIFEDGFDPTTKTQSFSSYTSMLKEKGYLDLHPNFSYQASSNVNVRQAGEGCAWFPSADTKVLTLENLNVAGYTNLTLSFQLVGESANKVQASDLKVKLGERELDALPDEMLNGGADYTEYILELGDLDPSTQEVNISFHVDPLPANGGIRLGNLVVKGYR